MSSRATWSAMFGAHADSGSCAYDEVLVPRVFEPWARVLLDKLKISTGASGLDVACGPGTVTRLLSARVGQRGHVAGCDLSQAMLAAARAKPPVDGGCSIDYVECSADALSFRDGQFDVVTCQQGIQFFPDRPTAIAEMRRVLRPGGRIGLVAWTTIEQSPPFDSLARAIELAAGKELAARYAAGPWALPQRQQLQALLRGAGFIDVRVNSQDLPVVFERGAAQLVRTLSASRFGAELSETQIRRIAEVLDERLGPGRIDSTAQANIALAHR